MTHPELATYVTEVNEATERADLHRVLHDLAEQRGAPLGTLDWLKGAYVEYEAQREEALERLLDKARSLGVFV